jgi:hypothetical protein
MIHVALVVASADAVLLAVAAEHELAHSAMRQTGDESSILAVEITARALASFPARTAAGLGAKAAALKRHMLGGTIRDMLDDAADVDLQLACSLLADLVEPAGE